MMNEIIQLIDAEIVRLRRVRGLLSEADHAGSGNHRRRRRTMSPEVRARIAEAQRRRWATRKKK